MQVRANEFEVGDSIKIAGYVHTVAATKQRGGHTDLTVENSKGRSQTLTCDSKTRFVRVDR